MTPEQEAEVLALMRQARERDRGYASFFGWAIDRDLEELGVVRALGESLAAEDGTFFGELRVRGRGQDPPDVEGVNKSGEPTAFEVTELVDGEAIKAFKAGRHYDYADWDQRKFLAVLSARLQGKAERRSKLKGGRTMAATSSWCTLTNQLFQPRQLPTICAGSCLPVLQA